jgi:CheY-like chemotaxis protein
MILGEETREVRFWVDAVQTWPAPFLGRFRRKQGIDTPIVALTANAMKGDDKKCFEAGCDEYLPKPIDQTELIKIFKRFLKKDGQQKN